MGLSVKGGSLTSPTSTGNVGYTGIGGQPKLLILYSTLVNNNSFCSPTYGVGASSSARWTQSQFSAADNPSTPSTNLFDSSKIFRWAYPTTNTLIAADLVSMDADGFTLNWTTVDAAGYQINFLCLWGSDLSVKVGTFDTNTSTGNQSVTAVGFPTKAVLFGGNALASNDGTVTTARGNIGIGAATSASARHALGSRCEAGAATADSTGLLTTDRCWTWLFSTEYGDADFVSNDADGFTVNITTVNDASVFRVGYVALGGAAQFAVGTFAQPGATGNQSVNDLGFPPSCELFWSGGKAASNTISDHARFMLGHAVSSSDRGVLWASQEDNASSPAEQRATVTTKSILIHDDNSTGIVADADFVSQDAYGFTHNWLTVDATARVVAYLAIGAAAGGAATWGPLLGGQNNRLVR